MFNPAKMHVGASDVLSDEECEELADDGFSLSADMSEKITRRKRSSAKPPPSPKSPYLSSLNVNPRRAAVAAWRLPRASLGDTRGDTLGGVGSAQFTSLSNGHDLSQTLRCDVMPELLKKSFSMRKHKHFRSASNNVTFGGSDYSEREDMYDEIIRLKKSLHAQKSDNQRMKAKLRRLEEDNAKREKQLEELLDPTKGAEYTRSLVDKKKEGSVVLNGLKYRILKLEQQCREKENALSKLQSELRTSTVEELKITVKNYFEESQRLRILLDAAEKSSRAESKCSQRQQKALSSTVMRLSENLKQLQQENSALREEVDTETPAGGAKGYREWSKQRLLRRLFELEKRLQDRRHTHRADGCSQFDQEVQTTPTEILHVTPGFAMATKAVVSVGTVTEEADEVFDLRESVSQLEAERVELQESLARKEDEVRQLRTEKEEVEKETARCKAEETSERDKERQQHQQELEQLKERIQTLELAEAQLSSISSTTQERHEDMQAGAHQEEGEEEEEEGGCEGLGPDVEKGVIEDRCQRERDKAAKIIQANWREHRKRDIVMLQSAFRGHLLREAQLKNMLKDTHKQGEEANCSSAPSPAEADLDVVALTMIQSAFRGHLARCCLTIESSEFSVPSPVGNGLPALVPRRPGSTRIRSRKAATGEKRDEDLWPVSEKRSCSVMPTTAQSERHSTAGSGGGAAIDSDDSDDIIVSPSRPLRSREVLIL